MTTEHAGWTGNTENETGIATLTAGGKTLTLALPNFTTYMALMDLIRAAKQDALQTQATYLRGAIGRLLDQR